MLHLYKYKPSPVEKDLSPSQQLHKFRFNLFCKKTSANLKTTKKVSVNLASLPPSVDSFKEHLKRVYFQVQSWIGFCQGIAPELNPTDWGWKIIDGDLCPTRMLSPPAPEDILNVITCSCKTGCGRACGCRKSGMFCTLSCLICKGNDCTNVQSRDTPLDEELEIITEDNENYAIDNNDEYTRERGQEIPILEAESDNEDF